MWPNPEETADLVTFYEEILNGKLHFLCSAVTSWVDFPQAGDAIYKNLAKTVIESIFPLI